jgi:hypothetical protein
MNVKKDDTREMKMQEKKSRTYFGQRRQSLFAVKAIKVGSSSKPIWCKGRYDEAGEM